MLLEEKEGRKCGRVSVRILWRRLPWQRPRVKWQQVNYHEIRGSQITNKQPGRPPTFPHPLCHLAGMKKRRDQCIQVFIRHPGLKSDSWVGDFEVAIRGRKRSLDGFVEIFRGKRDKSLKDKEKLIDEFYR